MSWKEPCSSCEANATLATVEAMYAQIRAFKGYYPVPADFSTMDAQQRALTEQALLSYKALVDFGVRPHLPRYPEPDQILFRADSPEAEPAWIIFQGREKGWQKL